jgi:hypothetical protein
MAARYRVDRSRLAAIRNPSRQPTFPGSIYSTPDVSLCAGRQQVSSESEVRTGLPAGESWIRTFSSALDRQQFVVSRVGADLPAHGHPSSCRPRRTDRVVGRGPERRHPSPGSGDVTPRSRCRRCERVAEPKVRIRTPPAESHAKLSPSSLRVGGVARPASWRSSASASAPAIMS